MSVEQSCHKQMMLNSDKALIKWPLWTSCKMPEFFENSPLSKAEKHPDFQVTQCHQNVSTKVDFAYIKSE